MSTPAPVQRQGQIKGGRKIRHVVNCSWDQHERLVKMANANGVTVAKLLVDTTLDDETKLSRRTLFNELAAIRSLLTQAVFDGRPEAIEQAFDFVTGLGQRINQA